MAINGGGAGWLPLSTAVALSGDVRRGVSACGASSAATLLATGSGGVTDASSLPLAVVSLIGVDCRAAGAGLLSAATSLIGADCRAAGAELPLPVAVLPTDAICELKVLSAASEAVSDWASSHAQSATPQIPTVTDTPAAITALPDLLRPLAETSRIWP
jgi:hypothetical protein